MSWLLVGLLAYAALSAHYCRLGWALWRVRRMRRMLSLVRTGLMDSRSALQALATGLRVLSQGWIGRLLGRWHLWIPCRSLALPCRCPRSKTRHHRSEK